MAIVAERVEVLQLLGVALQTVLAAEQPAEALGAEDEADDLGRRDRHFISRGV